MVKWSVLSAAGIPVVVFGSILYNRAGTLWGTGLSRPVLAGAALDTLLVDTVLLILAAPVVAAAVGARARRPFPARSEAGAQARLGGLGILSWLIVLVAGFVVSSAGVSSLGWGASGEAAGAIIRSHVTLATAGLALAGVGAWCGLGFRHPLDAVGCSLGVSLVATGAILAGGPALADAPQPLVAAGLLASPLVTTAAAAGLDVFRTDVLYQVSPLAHVRLDYPAWQAAAGLYLLVALACFAGVARAVRRPTAGSTD